MMLRSCFLAILFSTVSGVSALSYIPCSGNAPACPSWSGSTSTPESVYLPFLPPDFSCSDFAKGAPYTESDCKGMQYATAYLQACALVNSDDEFGKLSNILHLQV